MQTTMNEGISNTMALAVPATDFDRHKELHLHESFKDKHLDAVRLITVSEEMHHSLIRRRIHERRDCDTISLKSSQLEFV